MSLGASNITTTETGAPTPVQPHPHHHHGWWWKTLLAGFALWIVTIVVTAVTQNANLVPTLILLGSFLVPFCVVLFVIERVTGTISTLQLVLAFFIGGILGVLGASLLEADLQQSVLSYGLVGLIEEFVKGLLLVIIGWRVRPKTAAQGALLGATVGAGFAAFESAGYAFNAAITSQGIDLFTLLQTEVIRALLAPVGHVLWTAIFGAVLFGVARARPVPMVVVDSARLPGRGLPPRPVGLVRQRRGPAGDRLHRGCPARPRSRIPAIEHCQRGRVARDRAVHHPARDHRGARCAHALAHAAALPPQGSPGLNVSSPDRRRFTSPR